MEPSAACLILPVLVEALGQIVGKAAGATSVVPAAAVQHFKDEGRDPNGRARACRDLRTVVEIRG